MSGQVTAKIRIDKDYTVSQIDERLYGSFLEHVGRAIYTGIYEPGHPSADENGFRLDVMDAIKKLHVPVIRYPGGNFVSGYNWEDGIGPVSERPHRLDLASSSMETNEFGTDEFCKWAEIAKTDVMMTVNLGTRGADAARNLVEYCNHPGNSYWSDMRKKNASEQPYNIKMWCLGNEMDGPWQMGRKTALEYGRLAAESAKLMRLVDPSIELVLCGSSHSNMPSYPEWEATVLDHAYEYADYIAFHAYYEYQNNDMPSFLATNMNLEDHIKTMIAACDYIQAKKRSKKQMQLSFDEWNVRYRTNDAYERVQRTPWTFAPAMAEEYYVMADALVVGSVLTTMINHSDRLRVACLAQLVNIIAPILTQKNGSLIYHTTYFPFLHASVYGRGTALKTIVNSPKYDCRDYTDVPYIDSAAVFNEDNEQLTLFLTNKDLENAIPLEIDIRGFEDYRVVEHIVLEHTDIFEGNTFDNPTKIQPHSNGNAAVVDGMVNTSLGKASWNVIRLCHKK